jgi:predicted nicotinamide N-methyase
LNDRLAGDDAVDMPSHPDPTEFIRANMRIAPVPALPEIRLYTTHPGSGLRRLAETEAYETGPDEEETRRDEDGDGEAGGGEDGAEPRAPYWAYAWAGGAVLARYILDRPETVAGRRVLDLGAGSGLVGIAAAKAGAREVTAAEIDRNGVAALGLNAAANGVAITIVGEDITAGPPPQVDLVTVGDLFYGRDLADRVIPFLDRCLAVGIEVLVGDPGRAYLPRARLRLLAEYDVPDVGEAREVKPSGVFWFEPERQA